jgi:predicted nucleic acid-binding protein
MKRVFADTSFYVAILNVDDAFHAKADALALTFTGETVTTEYVIVELGNWLSRASSRQAFPVFVEELQADPQTMVVPAEGDLLAEGIRLYARRPDKDWSLTDCLSFVVMDRLGLQDALAADHHFHQAGFNALLI